MPKMLCASLSFEERSLAALEAWAADSEGGTAVFFDYGNVATPEADATAVKVRFWSEITRVVAAAGATAMRPTINPYSVGDMQRWITSSATEGREVLFDLSCFSRLHVIAIAATLAEHRTEGEWKIAYTLPLSYGDLNASSAYGGWRDTLTIPIDPEATLENEGDAVGIMLLGHQADRALLALSEFEPGAGKMLVATRDGRPDFHRRLYAKNKLLVEHLSHLRLTVNAGNRVKELIPTAGWALDEISFAGGPRGLWDAISSTIAGARLLKSPVVLFPFGPKVVVFGVAYALARAYPQGSWVVYPVAATHALDYSDGVSETAWYDIRDFEEMSNGSWRT